MVATVSRDHISRDPIPRDTGPPSGVRRIRVMARLQCRFPPDPPCTRGHFPAHPIVPGAFLLDEVIRALAGALRLTPGVISVEAAKFASPVGPGQCVDLDYDEIPGGAAGTGVKFRGQVDGRTVISGSLRFRP